MDPFSLTAAALFASTSVAQATAQNRAVKRSMASAQDAEAVQQGQINDAESLEILKNQNAAAGIRGKLRVASAEAGVGDGSDQLFQQAEYDASLGERIIGQNAQNERRRVASGLQANLAEIASRGSNAVLQGLTGAFQGALLGLQIKSLNSELNPQTGLQLASPTPTPPVAFDARRPLFTP